MHSYVRGDGIYGLMTMTILTIATKSTERMAYIFTTRKNAIAKYQEREISLTHIKSGFWMRRTKCAARVCNERKWTKRSLEWKV